MAVPTAINFGLEFDRRFPTPDASRHLMDRASSQLSPARLQSSERSCRLEIERLPDDVALGVESIVRFGLRVDFVHDYVLLRRWYLSVA